jgi:SAM-dependent methyltransferase
VIRASEKYAQPAVVKFWQEFARQGLQVCEQEMLARYAPPPPARVLDLGCGSGRAGMALTARGYNVMGLDLSWKMLAAARELAEHAQLVQADLQKIPHAPASFEIALILIAALQHVPTRAARQNAFAEMARVLKPRGVLLLALDNLAPALTCYAWWGWNKFFPTRHSATNLSDVRAENSADALLESNRAHTALWLWHMRGIVRTLRWRTVNGWLDFARRARVLRGEVGDTAIDQVSLTPTAGRVYYHLYRHAELVADARAGGLELCAYHSGRELSEGKTFAPRVRQLDKQVLYAFQKITA